MFTKQIQEAMTLLREAVSLLREIRESIGERGASR